MQRSCEKRVENGRHDHAELAYYIVKDSVRGMLAEMQDHRMHLYRYVHDRQRSDRTRPREEAGATENRKAASGQSAKVNEIAEAETERPLVRRNHSESVCRHLLAGRRQTAAPKKDAPGGHSRGVIRWTPEAC